MTAPTPTAPGRTRRWPVRLILVGIGVALVLPGLVFCVLLLTRIADTERTRSIEAAQGAAQRAAEALDREIGNLTAALLALSTSQALRNGDLPMFDHQARTVAGVLRQAVILAEPDGQQLVNTRFAPGQALPRMGSLETLRRLLATREPSVSDLFEGGTAGTLAVVVQFPVVLDDRVAYVLAMSLRPDYLSELLRRQALPRGWVATLLDGGYRVVASNQGSLAMVGTQVPENVVPRARPNGRTGSARRWTGGRCWSRRTGCGWRDGRSGWACRCAWWRRRCAARCGCWPAPGSRR